MPQQNSQLNSSESINDKLLQESEQPSLLFKLLWYIGLVPRSFVLSITDVLVDTASALDHLIQRNKTLEERNKDLEEEVRRLDRSLKEYKEYKKAAANTEA